MRELKKDNLQVKIYDQRTAMGQTASDDVSHRIEELLEDKDHINVVFAAAPSQNEFLAALAEKKLPWERINAFHMDEYVGLSGDAPQLFGNFLRDRILGRVPFRSVHYFNGNADDLGQSASGMPTCSRLIPLIFVY
jgi:glucosamine-6-phosphate deaminase